MTTKAKEKPILFSGWEVRAILEGRKTQTRRVVNPQPNWSGAITCDWYYPTVIRKGQEHPGERAYGFSSEDEDCPCPYGGPGDRLWVRETWWQRSDDGVIVFDADGAMSFDKTSIAHQMGIKNIPCEGDNKELLLLGFKKRPSIFMPRWASRITLEVTAARVERLQGISTDDVFTEGAQIPVNQHKQLLARMSGKHLPSDYWPVETFAELSRRDDFSEIWIRSHFASLWDSINAKSHPWASNPWVWVVEFRKCD